MNDKAKLAIERFSSGWACSQVLIGAYCEEYGLSLDMAKAISSGFGGGMRCGEVCGVVSGAIMVIGLWSNHKTPDAAQDKILCADKVKCFLAKFKEEHQHIRCRDILRAVAQKMAQGEGEARPRKICTSVIETAICILDEILIEKASL